MKEMTSLFYKRDIQIKIGRKLRIVTFKFTIFNSGIINKKMGFKFTNAIPHPFDRA